MKLNLHGLEGTPLGEELKNNTKIEKDNEKELPEGAIGFAPDGKTPIYPAEDAFEDIGYHR